MKKMTKAEYRKLLDEKSPPSPMIKDICMAFLFGGTISTIGQAISDFYTYTLSMTAESASAATSITLIFIGSLFTGVGIYDKIAKIAGAGTLIPITGFANAVTSSAMEFKSEGYVPGMAVKMFIIAGPVIVFGILSSVTGGLAVWLIQNFCM